MSLKTRSAPALAAMFLVLCLALCLVACSDDDDPTTVPTTGSVAIDAVPDQLDAPWSLAGPDGYALDGHGDLTVTGLAPGDYTLTWGRVTGWVAPLVTTRSLLAGRTVTFGGTYEEPGVTATQVREIGSQGTGDGEFSNVADVAIDPDGNVWVCDFGNDRVEKFAPDGTYLLQFARTAPTDIETDASGDVYVWGNFILDKYDETGARLNAFRRLNAGNATNGGCHFAVSPVSNQLTVPNLSGTTEVWDAAAAQEIYLDLTQYNLLRLRESDGSYLTYFGSPGTGEGEFGRPFTLAYGPLGLLYVLDTDRGTLQVFGGDYHIRTISPGFTLYYGNGLAVDREGRIYLSAGTSVNVYSADGGRHDVLTVDYDHGNPPQAAFITAWYDAAADEDLLYVASATSVLVYRLDFVGW